MFIELESEEECFYLFYIVWRKIYMIKDMFVFLIFVIIVNLVVIFLIILLNVLVILVVVMR